MAFKNFRKGKRPKENKQESSNKFEQPDIALEWPYRQKLYMKPEIEAN